MRLKIMEWNINQRMNYSGRNMPHWIAKVINEKDADIIALTEVYKGNNWENIKSDFLNSNYALFETSNNSAGQNDIVIAININKINILYAKTYYPSEQGIPDYLEVKCKDKESNSEFVIACIRIHALVSDDVKCQELRHTMKVLKNESKVIVCGDFNNYRRGFVNNNWCLSTVHRICRENDFVVKTPEGSSIYQEKPRDVNYEFPEDHFLIKGIKEEEFTLFPYDRDFVEKDKKIYKWGRDFQVYLGKDPSGKYIYDSVPTPFPDHAILECEVMI